MSTPIYLNSPTSPFPFIELKEDHPQPQFFINDPPPQASSSSLSSSSSPVFFNTIQDQADDDHKCFSYSGSRTYDQGIPSSSSLKPVDHHSTKDEPNFPNNGNNIVRSCSDCNTTKTPLWRSGPQGPKSLCNACGIRQRKARRAMAAAACANGDNSTITGTSYNYKVTNKEKKSRTSFISQCKKPLKLSSANPDQIGDDQKTSFEDFALRLSTNVSTLRRGFPKDEEEAAILLMALSCGLLHS